MEVLGNVADLDHYGHAPSILHLQRISTADEDSRKAFAFEAVAKTMGSLPDSRNVGSSAPASGCGIITPIGSLRADIGVPLDRALGCR
jgi:hypothetical protein